MQQDAWDSQPAPHVEKQISKKQPKKVLPLKSILKKENK
jgi:hypothetical protein